MHVVLFGALYKLQSSTHNAEKKAAREGGFAKDPNPALKKFRPAKFREKIPQRKNAAEVL